MTPGSESNDEDEFLNVLYGALTHSSRRQLLAKLSAAGGSMSIDGLVEQLAERSGDGEAKSLALELHHVHLPKLLDSGLIEWDRTTDEVALSRAVKQTTVSTTVAPSRFETRVRDGPDTSRKPQG